jgi:manganese/zinc/iron transport system substrate-binding protein
LAPEGQLGSEDIKKIIDHLLRYDIHVIFPESNVSKDSIKKIVDAAQQRGHSVIIAQKALYADAMGPLGSEGGSYVGMVLWDARTIAEYLDQNVNEGNACE